VLRLWARSRPQVKQFDGEMLHRFWSRWYFPANATLYVVGQLDRSVEDTIALIQRNFGRIPAGREDVAAGDARVLAAEGSNGGAAAPVPLGRLKQRHPVTIGLFSWKTGRQLFSQCRAARALARTRPRAAAQLPHLPAFVVALCAAHALPGLS
jgi:Peptidase M16 inactive domain